MKITKTKKKICCSADSSLPLAAFNHDYYYQGHWTRQILLFSGTYVSDHKSPRFRAAVFVGLQKAIDECYVIKAKSKL